MFVVGRDIHQHDWARVVVDACRNRFRTIAVDMGWPSTDFSYADIATFGASRLVGQALRETVGR